MAHDGSAPLHGVRVLEVGTHRAGAFAGAILADLGADVVTVARGADAPDGAARLAFDRGKRSVAVDPRRPGAVERRLVGWADVVVEEDAAWRSGGAPAGLDQVVHCTVTPFGPPSGRAGSRPVADPGSEDLLVQALSGNMDLTGFAGGPPSESGIPVADLGSGVFAVIGVLAGVVGGGPRRIEVAKIDVAVALLSYMAVGYFADGEVPTRVGTGHSTIFPYNAFEAADGEVVVAPFTSRFWRGFATAAGRDDLAHDDRYRGFAQRLRAKDELLAEFVPILRRRTVDEWVAVFAAADVPAGPVLTLEGALGLPHTVSRGMTPTLTAPDGTTTRTVGSPFRFRAPDGAVFRPHPGAVRTAGADTAEVLAGLDARARRPASPAPPLAGVRVVDLTRMFAGPCATEVLADLGADVVKVEEPRIGDPTRRNLPMWGPESAYFMSLNRGKRSVALDLRSEQGRGVLLELIDGADVLVENFRPGVMARLGLDHETLAARRPGLVFCSLSGFGATGPLRDKISFDLVNQAMAGMIELTGDVGERPVRIGVPIGDMAGGLQLAVAVLAGLAGRDRTGQGCWVDLALHDVLIGLLSDVAQRHFLGEEGVTRAGSRGRDTAPHGRYRARDGWLVLSAVRDAHWAALTAVLGIPRDDRFTDAHLRKRHEAALDAVLAGRLATADVAEWVRDLTAAGVPAAPVNSLADALGSPLVRGRGLVYEAVHPTAGRVRNLASPLLVDGGRPGTGATSPVLGADTDDVLAELGHDGPARARLADEGVVRCS